MIAGTSNADTMRVADRAVNITPAVW